jgi:hypothetical protein
MLYGANGSFTNAIWCEWLVYKGTADGSCSEKDLSVDVDRMIESPQPSIIGTIANTKTKDILKFCIRPPQKGPIGI